MNYKVGERVRIREDIEVARDITKILKKINRVVTIEKIIDEYYVMKEIRAYWRDYHIEEPEVTRFELMEL